MANDGMAGPWLGDDREHVAACHRHWSEAAMTPGPATLHGRGEWSEDQCGACRYYLPLTGALGADWGICSNSASPCDGVVMFEHDGCNAFSAAEDGWGGPHRSFDYLHRRPYRSPFARGDREGTTE